MSSFHKILNRIESVKEKLTDLEYKNLVEEIQKEYKKQSNFYLVKYIEYSVESNSSSIHYPRQSFSNIGDELKTKITLLDSSFENIDNYDLFNNNKVNQDMIDEFNFNKFIHFLDDSNPYSLSIIFIYSIELLR